MARRSVKINQLDEKIAILNEDINKISLEKKFV